MSQKKLAVFVEGQTETIFVKKLLMELAGSKNISFKETSTKNLISLNNGNSQDIKKYFVLIVDCHNDNAVKSKILENRTGLIKASYDLVIGLRDIYPVTKKDIPRLELGMRTGVPTKDLNIEFCLAKMEIEAWFLQEHTHYQKIDNRLTNHLIFNGVGFDPLCDCAENIAHPADLLKCIYQLVGKTYRKKRSQVQRTVDSLDYEEVYTVLPSKLDYFKNFLCHVEGFMT